MYGHFLPPWWLLLAAFSVAYGMGIGTIAVMRRSAGKKPPQSVTLPGPTLIRIPLTSQTKRAPWISPLAVFLLSGAVWAPLGYYYRADREQRVRYTYKDVLIVARADDRHFTLQPARMQPFTTGLLCDAETDLDYWQPLQKMESLTFSLGKTSDGRDCKDVEHGGEYSFYKDHGKPITFRQEVLDARK